MVYPGGETIQYTSYDTDGALLEMRDAANRVTQFLYNEPGGALTNIIQVGNSSQNVVYGYDVFGRKTSVSHSRGDEIYSYGPQGQLASIQRAFAFGPTRTLSFTYDKVGNRLAMSSPNGAFGGTNTFTYSYDVWGRMSGLTNPFGEASSWNYDTLDRLTSQTKFNGVDALYGYDDRGRLNQLRNRRSGIVVSEFNQFGYTDNGLITGFNGNYANNTVHTGAFAYGLNAKNELVTETKSGTNGYSRTYAYETWTCRTPSALLALRPSSRCVD